MNALTTAQASFRQSPSRVTALAYMDAAIEEWETECDPACNGDVPFVAAMRELRAWLMNEGDDDE